MRLRNLFFALAASIGVAAAPAGAQEMADSVVSGPLMLTLEQALDIALSENPTVKIADQTVEVKKYAKRGTYAGLWPEISASATYNRYIKKQTMHIMDQTMTVGTSNIYQGGFSATMPVVNAQLWKSLKISAMDVELAVEQARGSRIDMIEQVSKAFYQVLLAKDSYTVYKRVYDNAVENHKIVTKKYEVGSVSEYEFLRSKVTVSNAEPDVLNAENSIVVALWQLKALLGMDLDIDIDCAGSLADYESMMTSHFDMEFNPERNSEMKQLEIQERQLQKTLEMQRAANLPTLDLSASYNFTAMEDTFKFNQYTWNPYSYAGLQLNIPIFAGNAKRAATRQARLDLSNLQLQRQDTERQLRVSIIQCLNNMQTGVKQYNSASATVDQAQRGYDIAVKRYEIGNGTLVEIDNSQLALTQAELSRNQSIYNFLVAKVTLDKILGNIEL